MSTRAMACAAIILAGLGSISGASASDGSSPFPTVRIAIPVVLPASDRPFIVRAMLGTNTTNSTRELAALDEDDGIRQILELTASSMLEEQWAYLPDLGLWIEVGLSEEAAEQ